MIDDIIRKHALRNALLHGKAIVNAVIPKVIGEVPESKNNIKELINKIKIIVNDVNKLSGNEIINELKSIAPELLEKKKNDSELRELPNVNNGVIMRIAPFPSGAAHIGNTRGMILIDEYVKKYGGKYYLVFDDTIGSDAKPIDPYAYESIPKMMKWLGCKIDKIIYKSDRLNKYYSYAEKMIKKGLAYVCECSPSEFKEFKLKKKECPHRSRSVKENLTKWHEMFNMKPGKAVLRIKTSMSDKDPAFRDRVIMRISDATHPRVGNKFRIWPLMDFSWAVDDMDLGITHIFRGKELYIEDRMERFIWNKMGEDYNPVMLHWGLLKIEGVKISKSKSRQEVISGKYSGWDDPRTWSLESLKRRGIKPEAIREFINELGVSENDIKVPISKLYTINRRLIDSTSLRYFFVKDPIKLIVSGCYEKKIKIPLHPKMSKFRSYIINDGVNEFWISGDDVKSLSVDQSIRLKDAINIKITSIGKTVKAMLSSNQSEVYDIRKIQFVINGSDCEVLMPDGSISKGLCEQYCSRVKIGDIIQFERFGFVRKEGEGKYIYTHN